MFDQENHLSDCRQRVHAPRKPLGSVDLNAQVVFKPDPSLPSARKSRGKRKSPSNGDQPLSVTRRNERERNRVKLLNLGFERLRAVVPSHGGEQLSKISTLKKAIWYIEHLDRVLHGQADQDPRTRSGSSNAVFPPVVPTTVTRQPTADLSIQSTSQAGPVAFGKAPWSSGGEPISPGPAEEMNRQLSSPIFPTPFNQLSTNWTNKSWLASPPTVFENSSRLSSICEGNESGYESMCSRTHHVNHSDRLPRQALQQDYTNSLANRGIPPTHHVSTRVLTSHMANFPGVKFG